MGKAIALAAAGFAALGLHRYAALRRKMSAVAPELRTPLLATTSIPFNRLTLPIVRFAMGRESDPGPGITLTEHRLEDADVEVLVLTPSEHLAPGPGVLWLHGGGLVAGTARFEAPWAGRLVAALGSVVVSPELSPRSRKPVSRRARRLHVHLAVDGETRRRARHRYRSHRRVRSERGRRAGCCRSSACFR